MYFQLIFFDLMSAIVIEAWHSRVKIVILCSKIECFSKEIFSKTYVKYVSELCE